MPKRDDINSIMIIGAGPIIIGQACEFDYSGTQACRALKQEGYKVILINSNPATIMTDEDMADRIYIEPLIVPVIERIIDRERPDGVLGTLGGQLFLSRVHVVDFQPKVINHVPSQTCRLQDRRSPARRGGGGWGRVTATFFLQGAL